MRRRSAVEWRSTGRESATRCSEPSATSGGASETGPRAGLPAPAGHRLPETWTRARHGYQWTESAGGWRLVERRIGGPADPVAYRLRPAEALLDFIRLARLAEAGRPVGLRRHVLRFCAGYGWLGAAGGRGEVGEPLEEWVQELTLAARWWRAGQWIAHCRIRAGDRRPMDAQVLRALVRQLGLGVEGESQGGVVDLAVARLTCELHRRRPPREWASTPSTLLEVLHRQLAHELRLGLAAGDHHVG